VIKMAFEIVPFRPFSDLPDLWDTFFETPHFHFGFDFGVPMDISETKDSVVVEAEMPGMESKSLDISLNGDLLTIRGEKKQETKTDNDDCYCIERTYGKFSRSVRLPGNVKSKSDEIKATYKDGVIRIEIPKTETKTIKITAS
jgi:HSP20 family protein